VSKTVISIEPGTVLVVSEWRHYEGDDAFPSTIRGVCSTVDDLYALLKRLWVYDPDSSERTLKLVPCSDDETRGNDPDLYATSQIVIVGDDGDVEETDFFIWDSSKSKGAYEPLKLYWATTDGGEEDWFIVARSAKDAAFEHAAAEGFDSDEASAEYILDLPVEAQRRFADAKVCWPDKETLMACGAKFVRDESPRVVEVAGRTFTEGMMERLVEMARSGRRPDKN